MIEIRYLESADRDFWFSLDKHLPGEQFAKKVQEKQGYVLRLEGKPIGLLRYNFFWDNIPFCTMLFIESGYQKKGYGKQLMQHWESDMKKRGYDLVLTSTRADEQAQHFYRSLGYRDCGGLVIGQAGCAQPMELFLAKCI